MQTTPRVEEDPLLEIFSPLDGERERTRRPTALSELPDIMDQAREAQGSWSAKPLSERRRHLLALVDHLAEHAEDYAKHIHRYNGKTLDEALMSEVYATLATFKWFAKQAHRHLRPQTVRPGALPLAHSVIHHDPLGVVGVIAPWNYPFKLMLQDVPAALMAGNAVVIKASEYSVAIGELAEQLFADAGLPANLVQVIYGFGDLGNALIGAGIDKVVFTGSTATGRKVYAAAAERLIPCSLEMGGKDAAILLEDADLDDAARGILWAGMSNSGQTCASVELVHVPQSLQPSFLDKLGELVRTLPAGSVGAMNVSFQGELVEQQVTQAVERGATIVAESAQGDASQPFRRNPIVLTDVPRDCDIYCKETFGPVVVVTGYNDLGKVIDEVNASHYGLTTSLWTRDRKHGEQLANRIDSGVVTINEHMITAGLPEAPWLGHKESGLGLSLSHLSLHSFTRPRYVYHDRGIVKYKFWRYPFTARKAAWFRRFMNAEFGRSWWTRTLNKLRALPPMLWRHNERFEEGKR